VGLHGDVGRFIFSLPVVLTCSLVASRIVSMTFIQLLGYVLLRPPSKPEPSLEERRAHGFARVYYGAVGWCVDHRFIAFGAATLALVGALGAGRGLRTAFFPKDLSYLSYVDIWLPADATLAAARDVAFQAAEIIRRVAGDDLASITTFVGGGGPRFWFSVSPELSQLNYAQLIIQVKDKHRTTHLIGPLQQALARVPGARIAVRQLQTGKPVRIPVQGRLAGESSAAPRP